MGPWEAKRKPRLMLLVAEAGRAGGRGRIEGLSVL